MAFGLPLLAMMLGAYPATVYVSPTGNDQGSGSKDKPFATINHALKTGSKTIVLLGGTYHQSIDVSLEHSGVTIKSEGERAVLTAATPLDLRWEPYRDGIWKASLPLNQKVNRVWLNDSLLHPARYPNFDPKARYLGGTSADALSPERVAKWKDPAFGIVHSMHAGGWGDQWFPIVGKDGKGKLLLSPPKGNNRPSGLHPTQRYVENIFEELDVPGEWYASENDLYVYPPKGIHPNRAKCQVSTDYVFVTVHGDEEQPVTNVRFENIVFTGTAPSFFVTSEPLLRSDWEIYRGGAVALTFTENCSFVDCDFRDLGGNALFVNGQNRKVVVDRCHFTDIGASAICFVGWPEAVRNPLIRYEQRNKFSDISSVPGPATSDYPMECKVQDCLIERIGLIEKQTAGVQIAMARRITVKNTTIHDVPRAGINIGDGCWGGHIIEGCDVFDTVRETSDHGAFNSWGRDRYWGTDFEGKPMPVDMPYWDAMETTVLRGNRWQCSHGWDIDLDDGSSNYLIENNLCLEGGLKLREGYFRTARNNILVDNGLHLHVWYPNSGDVVERNLTWRGHAGPVGMPAKWGKSVDYNFEHRPGVIPVQPSKMGEISKADAHSLLGDALFVDEKANDWRLKANSPLLKLGFKPFPLDRFGVQKGRLRELAKQAFAQRPQAKGEAGSIDTAEHAALGGKVKNLSGISEISATGMGQEVGILVVDVPSGSELAKLGIQRNDVILEWGGKVTNRMKEFNQAVKGAPAPQQIVVWRGQKRVTLNR